MKTLITIFITSFIIITNTSAQKMNQRVFDEKTQTDILVGSCTRVGLIGCEFAISYDQEYSNYKPDEQIINELKNKVMGVKCTLLLGTWCGDSKEQVPRFFKILDLLSNPIPDIKIIAVDRNKEAPEININEQYKIEKVPTFIFYRDSTEIGRIIETPIETLERDLLNIVNFK